MKRQYLVVKLRPDADIGKIVELTTTYADRMAFADDIPGFTDQDTVENAGAPLKEEDEPGSDPETSINNLSLRRQVTEKVVTCGICKRKLTMRASYGRTRLRDHVLRHLDEPTVKCGYCDFKGVIRDHVRTHIKSQHSGESMFIEDLALGDDFKARLATLWDRCFPNDDIMPELLEARILASPAIYLARRCHRSPSDTSADDLKE